MSRAMSNAKQPEVTTVRNQLGLNQQEFATLLGLSTVSVSRWEHRHTTPTGASAALVSLLTRALAKTKAEEIVSILRHVDRDDDVNRFITLVHLGDPRR